MSASSDQRDLARAQAIRDTLEQPISIAFAKVS
jgi:hypothetical protein